MTFPRLCHPRRETKLEGDISKPNKCYSIVFSSNTTCTSKNNQISIGQYFRSISYLIKPNFVQHLKFHSFENGSAFYISEIRSLTDIIGITVKFFYKVENICLSLHLSYIAFTSDHYHNLYLTLIMILCKFCDI